MKDPTGKAAINAIASNRYANGLSRQVVLSFSLAAQELRELLYGKDPTSLLGPRRLRRTGYIITSADKIFERLYRTTKRSIADQLAEFAVLQESFAASLLTAAVAVDIKTKRLGKEFWKAIVTEDVTKGGLLVQGNTMEAWWAKQAADSKFLFRRQIQAGMTEQETIDQIVRRVRGRAIGGGRYAGGVIGASTRHATALVRTAVNQVSNRAHQDLYKANSDITKQYQYVATLDSRTTPICASLDGRIFDHGAGPVPPQHFNCRSTTTPVIDYKGLGLDPPPPGMRASKDYRPGKTGGPIPATVNYEEWLKGQPIAVQNEVLGQGKASLFRANRISLRDIVRRDNSVLTLEQLKETIG